MKMTYSRSLMDDLNDIGTDATNRNFDKLCTVVLHALKELERHELLLAELSKSDAE